MSDPYDIDPKTFAGIFQFDTQRVRQAMRDMADAMTNVVAVSKQFQEENDRFMQFNAVLPDGYAVSNGLWVIHPDDSYRLGLHVVGITEQREIVTLEFSGDPWAAVDSMIDDDAEPVTITDGVRVMAYKPTINGEVTEESRWTGLSIEIPDEYKEI